MRFLLVRGTSAGLIVACVVQLAYLAPGSLGQHDDSFGGLGFAVFLLTMVNLAVALFANVVGIVRNTGRWRSPRGQVAEIRFDLMARVSELLSRPTKLALAAVAVAAFASAVYGAVLTDTAYKDHGHFYRRTHGKLVPISHQQYVTATHPSLLFGAGICTILQIVAFCLTVLAIDSLAFRARGLTGWPRSATADEINTLGSGAFLDRQKRSE